MEFFNQSKYFASGLIEFGINEKDLAILFGNNCIDYAISLLAIIWTGIPFTPSITANGCYELMQQINDAQASILIIDQKKLNILKLALNNEKYREIIFKYIKLIIIFNALDNHCLSDESLSVPISILTFDQIMKQPNLKNLKTIPYLNIALDKTFCIFYTSGTTGLPKGSLHSNYSFLASLLLTKYENVRKILWYPFGHVSGTFSLLAGIITRTKMTLFFSDNLDELLNFASNNHLTALSLSPAHITKLILNNYQEKYDLTKIKQFYCSGETISNENIEIIKEKYSVDLIQKYGGSEFLPICSNQNIDPSKMASVGQPVPGVEIKIIDLVNRKNQPPNTVGEICIRGRQRFIKYLRNELATNEAIDSNGWYHSGDIGYYDNDGYLFITDRIKEIIKFRIWTIFPSEIENFIQQHRSVESVCVIGVPHKTDGQYLRAFVVRKDVQLTEMELINFVQG